MTDDGKHIVIIGGGFAGTTLAKSLETSVPKQHQITLLSSDNFITFNPLLAEVVGASILPGHVVAPTRQMLKRAKFRMVNVTGVDIQAHEIHYLGEGSGVINYDELIFAFGTNANLDLVKGMKKYALPLKTLGDALFLRNQMIVRLEQAELQDNVDSCKWLTTFVIIGGGFSGVEVAGEIADFMHAAHRYYMHAKDTHYKVILLHAGEKILPELNPKLSAYALEKMQKYGIKVQLNCKVAQVDDRGVTLDNGERINAGTIICTIGTTMNPLVSELGLPLERGRIITNPDMSIPDCPGLWAVGDCAAITNAYSGSISPPTAQFATRQAGHLAINISRRLMGQPTTSFSFKPLGQLSSIGHNKAVAQIFGMKFSGFIGWLLWRAVYLAKIPTLARKVRLFFEWNWEMFFPQDIVLMRFVRTRREVQR